MYFDILTLRVLAEGPRHGYEIKKSVERILGGRSINNNVLYPALRRFEEQGAIERVAAEADPGRPPRNVYRLTDTGHDLLQAMIRDADPALLADAKAAGTSRAHRTPAVRSIAAAMAKSASAAARAAANPLTACLPSRLRNPGPLPPGACPPRAAAHTRWRTEPAGSPVPTRRPAPCRRFPR